ncbi:MAG: SDR family oxidoreductase [Halobacteriales archaeon]|nr:SDR family oxidoreductase [Halobacteriales archaeon]
MPETPSPLDGVTALITGASAGIGRATAEALANDGANVALAARSEDRLETLAADIESRYDVETLVVPTDVTEEQQVERMVDRTVDRFDRLDVVVNNAGIGRPESVEAMPTESYREIMGVNIDGMFFTSRAAIPHLRSTAGTLVFIASYAGTVPYPSNPIYAATKWWTRGFALSLAGSLGEDGIAVTVINPSEVRTEFGSSYDTPYTEQYDPGEVTEPEEIGAAVAFAATQEPPDAVTELNLYRRDKFSRL